MADTGTGSSGDSGSSTKTRPIVFLDVDGVLCCNHETRLEAAPCAELQRIAESTRAAVVLSTDWRRDTSLSSRINHCLHERRVDCIGATPQLSGSMNRVSRVRPKETRSFGNSHVHPLAGPLRPPAFLALPMGQPGAVQQISRQSEF